MRTLYLASDGSAGDVFHGGRLTAAKPSGSNADRYVYDPLDTLPAELETDELRNFLNQRYLLHTFGNGLIYASEPFDQAAEITGYASLRVWIALDVPDTDFRVSLYEILSDGSSVLLADDLLRARFRQSLERETLVVPGAVLRYDFERFPLFSRRLPRGSRLRPFLRCPNTIYLEKFFEQVVIR